MVTCPVVDSLFRQLNARNWTQYQLSSNFHQMNYRMLHEVLYALFFLSRENMEISAHSLGLLVGVSPGKAKEVIYELERYDLVDATRMRLTMRGLAVAVSKSASVAGPATDRGLARSVLPMRKESIQPYAARGFTIPKEGAKNLLSS